MATIILKDFLQKWNMSYLKIKIPFLETELKFLDADKNAAWDLYVELLTRITTQPLPEADGDEKTALDSVFALFPLTRHVIKTNGRHCIQFTKIAIVVLNQIIRPFTARWHKLSLQGAFGNPEQCRIFRTELEELQVELKKYTRMLADMAGVEDLTELEDS